MNHKRMSIFTTIFFLAMVFILAGTVPVTAKSERIYVSGTDCPIYVGPPQREWVSEDGILHRRGVPMTNAVEYDSAYISGTGYLLANFDINLATGAVHGYGTIKIYPEAGGGTWVGRFNTHVSPEGVVDGNAWANGTGDFEGMKTFNTVSSPDVVLPECNFMNTNGNGYILVPNP